MRFENLALRRRLSRFQLVPQHLANPLPLHAPCPRDHLDVGSEETSVFGARRDSVEARGNGRRGSRHLCVATVHHPKPVRQECLESDYVDLLLARPALVGPPLVQLRLPDASSERHHVVAELSRGAVDPEREEDIGALIKSFLVDVGTPSHNHLQLVPLASDKIDSMLLEKVGASSKESKPRVKAKRVIPVCELQVVEVCVCTD
mmetsp:Transcript_13153/g.30558  ORF Transcript_13153/g.30558 Transcript_13153/m.30558 type:complete len:204 (-) Transcript_13153:782-1393(-)